MTPIVQHPENPHYLSFRGRSSVLVTSGEHYEAALNLDYSFAVGHKDGQAGNQAPGGGSPGLRWQVKSCARRWQTLILSIRPRSIWVGTCWPLVALGGCDQGYLSENAQQIRLAGKNMHHPGGELILQGPLPVPDPAVVVKRS